ncbi:uridine cytidine kinase I, putative [Entamoeba invadens IP1]|uniref:Uridine cytidine kinase I, putative n=1 Tax=Entamoeba invadens IP1 TaxID=370355 RepID=A0A0A1U9R9_ENTIV|nr:uridine cytidine kinase I, putative [Entamoeba invadens IP1]ELP88870.1 uridine cytidine kinase I, putative [Entamoeba invadens IP1]|eukprot:XP_004255641.1 uridine cytidine kinase I, putative [Entamoeba invadens IP1]
MLSVCSVVYNEKLYTMKYPITCDEVIKELKIQGQPAVIVGLKVNGIVQSINSYVTTSRCTVSPCYLRCVEGQNMCRRSELLLTRYAIHRLSPDVEMTIVGEYGDCTKFQMKPIPKIDTAALNEEFKHLHTKQIYSVSLPHNFLRLCFVETHQPHSNSLIESLNSPAYDCAMIDDFPVLSLSQPYLSNPDMLQEISTLDVENTADSSYLTVHFPPLIHTDSFFYEDSPVVTCPYPLDPGLDVGAVNKSVVQKQHKERMMEAENHHIQQLSKLIEIVQTKKTKLVLIAGPSSSGKTNFSHKVALGLQGVGYSPLVLSINNYYVHKNYCPLDANGKRDWECIDSLRLGLLNDHLTALLKGKEVVVPQFDFITSTPISTKGKTVKLAPNGIIVMEGIHCLNERLTEKVPHEKKVKVFIAPLSNGICLTDDVMLDNNFLRIQRRMTRDSLERGYTAKKTLDMWDQVAGSEKTWVYPFIKDADFVFTTFLTYEVNVLTTFSLNLLRTIGNDDVSYGFAQSYLRLLSYYVTLDSADVSKNSVMRDFIGDGVF